MTQRELIYSIRNSLGTGVSSEQSDFQSDRYIANQTDTFRALMVRQDLRKDPSIQSSCIQTLGPLPLETDPFNFPDKKVKKTKIPQTVTIANQDTGLTYVGSSFSPKASLPMQQATRSSLTLRPRYGKPLNKWYRDSENLYVSLSGEESVNSVYVSGIFTNPWEVFLLNNPDYEGDDYDFDYPVPSYLLEGLKTAFIQKHVPLMQEGFEDKMATNE